MRWLTVFKRLFRRDLPAEHVVFHPTVEADPTRVVKRLGTEYGGWSFVDDERFSGATIISAGLGEDASFDVEFASRYHARMILVDPTPRAIQHFEGIRRRLGVGRDTAYVAGGNQPVTAYDLSRLNTDSLMLVPKALWTHNRTMPFYAPSNLAYVSHSLTDIHHHYAQTGSSIEVECITIDRLLETFGLDAQPLLLKLDIEGAAIEVVRDMLKKEIYPYQLLVEFEELTAHSRAGNRKVEEIDRLLRERNYRLRVVDPPCNFSYTRQ